MTENLAARGEGLAGLVAKWRAEVEKCCPILLSDPKSNVTDASCRQQMRDADELETALTRERMHQRALREKACNLRALAALEAAAPPSTPHITAEMVQQADACWSGYGPGRWSEHLAKVLNNLLATPSPQAPPATEFGPFTLTVGELLADGIFHRCVESGEFNHALCAKMIDNALAEEKLSNIAATQEPAGSGADIGKVGASIDFRFAGSGAICAQCKANADWNDGAGYHELAEKCRQYFRDGHPCPSKSGSPRKVGEDGVGRHCEITGTSAYDCYSTQCPDCPYPELKLSREEAINAICLQAAEIVALKAALARSSSVPVGEQKQEEGV